MSEKDGNKQAAIASDGGINQQQWMDEPDFGAPTRPPPLQSLISSKSIDISPKILAEMTSTRPLSLGKEVSRIRESGKPYIHPSQFRGLGGQMISTPEQRLRAQNALVLARKYPDAADQWRNVASVNALGRRNILTEADIQEAEDPSFWENVGTFFEPFTTPQRLAWYVALKAGEWLPDPGTAAGDMTQDVVGAVGGALLATSVGVISSPKILWDAVFGEDRDDEAVSSGPSSGRATTEEFALTFSQMIENLYADVSTGELAERAEEHMRPWLWWDWSMAPAPTGDMLLDSLLPYDAAEHLSHFGETAAHRKFGSLMSNDMGRLVLGISLEIIADPLWFAGPAKATNVVTHGDDVYRLGSTLMKAAGNMELMDRASDVGAHAKDFQRLMVDLMRGTDVTEDGSTLIQRAEKIIGRYSDMALTDAEHSRLILSKVNDAIKTGDATKLREVVRSIAKDRIDQANVIATKHLSIGDDVSKANADRFLKAADILEEKLFAIAESPELASAWLKKQQRIIPLEARNSEKIAEQLKHTIEYARGARDAGPRQIARGAKKQGGLSWHIPFTTVGGNVNINPLGKAGELLRTIGPIDTAMDNVASYTYSALSNELEAAIKVHGDGISALDAFGGSHTKSFAWTMQSLGMKGLVLPFAAWDMLRRALGTRFIQPMTQSLQINLLENYNKLPSFSFQTTTIRRLKKAHPLVWDQYQEGLTKMMEAYTGLETQLRTTTMRLMKTAEQALEGRRRNSAEEVRRLVEQRGKTTNPDMVADLDFRIDEAKRWANKREYTITDILNEAGNAIETGAGKYASLSDDVKEVSEGIKAIIQKIVDDPDMKLGKITVEQALVQMVRLTKGNLVERGKILADMKVIDQTLSGLNLKRDKLLAKTKKIFQKRIVKIRTLESMVDNLSVDKLVDLLMSGKKTANAEALYADLLTIFGTEAAANSVLRNTAIAMGTSDGYKGIRLLAEELTSKLPAVKFRDPVELRKAIGIAIRDHLAKLKSEAAALRNAWNSGRLDGSGVTRAKVGDDEFLPGMSAANFNLLIDSMMAKERASWMLLVPEAERKLFKKWAGRGTVDDAATSKEVADLQRRLEAARAIGPESPAFEDARKTIENVTKRLDELGRRGGGDDLLRSLTAAMPEGGALSWQQAFGFYRRELGLREVQKTARRWKSKGFASRGKVYESIVPYASRHAREEAYRLADRAQASGAVIPEGFVSPSSWRQGAKVQLELDIGLGVPKSVSDMPEGAEKLRIVSIKLRAARRAKAAAEAAIAAATDDAMRAAAKLDLEAATLAEKEWAKLEGLVSIDEDLDVRLGKHITDALRRRKKHSKPKGSREDKLGKRKSGVGNYTVHELEEKIIEAGTAKRLAQFLAKELDDKALVHILNKIIPHLSDESFVFLNHLDKTPKLSLHPNRRITMSGGGSYGVSAPIPITTTPKGTIQAALSDGQATGTITEIHIRSVSNSIRYGKYHGVNPETLVHELLHNATSMRIHFATDFPSASSHLAGYVSELNNLVKIVQQSKHTKDLLPTKFNADELISWGLTNKGVRDGLKKIHFERQSAWTKFVEIVAGFLGLGKGDQNVLAEVLRLTEAVLDAPTDELARYWPRRGAEKPMGILKSEIKRVPSHVVESKIGSGISFGKAAEFLIESADDATSALIERILPKIDKSGKVRVFDGSEASQDLAGMFGMEMLHPRGPRGGYGGATTTPTTGEAHLDVIWLNKLNKGVTTEVLAHELTHAATFRALRAAQKSKSDKLYSKLENLRVTIGRKLRDLDPQELRELGLVQFNIQLKDKKGVDELISYAFAHKDTQSFLKTIKIDQESAWTKFVEAVADLLGLKKGQYTALDNVLDLTDDLLERFGTVKGGPKPFSGLPIRKPKPSYPVVGGPPIKKWKDIDILKSEVPFEPFIPAATKRGKGAAKPLSEGAAKNLKAQTGKVSRALLGEEGKLGLSEKYQKELRKAIENIKKDLDPKRVALSPDIDGLINDVVKVLEKLESQRLSGFSTLDEMENLEFLLRDLGEWSKEGGLGREFKPSGALSKAADNIMSGLNSIRKRSGALDEFHNSFIRILNGLLHGGNDVILDSLKTINKKYGKRIKAALPDEAPPIRRTPMGPTGLTADSLKGRNLGDALKGLTYDDFMDAMTTLLSRQRIMDPELKALLSEVAKRATVKRSVSKMRAETITADVQKIKDDMLSMLKTKGKPGKFVVETRRAAALAKKKITDEHGNLAEPLIKDLDDLKAKLARVARPKFPPYIIDNEIKFDGRDFEVWEAKLWDDFALLVAEKNLSVEDQLFAAFSVLREMPRGISKEMTKQITKKYPSVIGRRYGDVASDLKPVMEELNGLIKTYEHEYSKRSLSFMRNKTEMMQRWGVVEYAPHLYKEASEVGVEMAVYDKISRGGGSTKGLEQLLMREMDASKKRGLAGSILEINAITNAKKGSTDIIALDPTLLWARYTQANHALTTQDFLTTLIATGVMKGIRAGDTNLGVAVERTPGVLKTAQELAQELDYVPVFSRHYSTEEMELFINGKLEDLLARFPTVAGEEGVGVQKAIERLADELKEPVEKGFASWMRNTIEVKGTLQTEQALLRLRAAQAGKGQDLYDAVAVFNTRYNNGLDAFRKSWDADIGEKMRKAQATPEKIEEARKLAEFRFDRGFAPKVWDEIAEEINVLTRKHAPNVPKVRGKFLSSYLDADTKLWEQYIPAVVKQNMTEVIEMDPKIAGFARRSLEKINNFWKTRVTVIAVAFSTRNWLANNVSMAFDLGPMGVLNLKTHRQGLRLANATRWVEEYGSLEKAWASLNRALPATASEWEKTKHFTARTIFKKSGMKSILDDGFQLTDDFWMSADDLVTELTNRGVVSPAFTQVVDIAMAEQQLLEKALLGGARGDALRASKVGKVASAVEDALLVTVPTIMTGGVPIALPKKIGSEFVARTVENQARVFNFLSNFKKTNSFSDATAHVNKFLFNYGDLTQVQKRYMRLLVPFFTWNQKNVALQFDLMRTSPQMYANFHRLMIDGLPQALSASQSESAGERFVDYDPLSKEKLRERETHYLHTIQLPLLSLENTWAGDIPVPAIKRIKGKKGIIPWQNYDLQWGKLGKDYFPRLKNAQVQGLGLPQEALVNSMSLLMGAADLRNWPVLPLPGELGREQQARAFSSRSRWIRFMGETHALLRFAVEVGTRQHMFFDKPINELTDGRLVAEAVGAIRQVPFVGDTMADIMAHRTGLKGYTVYDKYSGSWKSFVKVDGAPNHVLGSMPWSRSLRDAAAMTDQFLISRTIPREELTGEGGVVEDELKELPFMYSVLDAGSGIRIKQTDPELMRAYSEKRMEKQLTKYLESIGLLKSWERSYVPFK